MEYPGMVGASEAPEGGSWAMFGELLMEPHDSPRVPRLVEALAMRNRSGLRLAEELFARGECDRARGLARSIELTSPVGSKELQWAVAVQIKCGSRKGDAS